MPRSRQTCPLHQRAIARNGPPPTDRRCITGTAARTIIGASFAPVPQRAPGLGMRLVNLPGYSPDFNADEAIWGWVREAATGSLCLGTKALVQGRVSGFLAGLAGRKDEVKWRCRTVLQSREESLLQHSRPDSGRTPNAHPTWA